MLYRVGISLIFNMVFCYLPIFLAVLGTPLQCPSPVGKHLESSQVGAKCSKANKFMSTYPNNKYCQLNIYNCMSLL